MVGIFSRFSVRGSHRRTQSALEETEAVPPGLERNSTVGVNIASVHGIEIAVEFKPVERPCEPLDNDQPIHCPLPEPSILNDGRIWKERVSSEGQRRAPIPKEHQSVIATRKPPRILPSISAPEHNILKLLDECDASGA